MTTKVKTEKKPEIESVPWIDHTQTIGAYKWLIGTGCLPCDIMIIGHYPMQDDMAVNAHFGGNSGGELRARAMTCGVDLTRAYMTNIVKFCPKGKKPKAGEVKACRDMLLNEISRAQPKVIVCLGGEALKAIMGKEYKISTHRGVWLSYPEDENITVLPTYALAYSQYKPAADLESIKDWKKIHNWQNNITTTIDPTHIRVIRLGSEADDVVNKLLGAAESSDDGIALALDCEWHGKTWMDPNGYLRTCQVAYAPDKALVFELVDEHRVTVGEPNEIFAALKRLFEHPKVKLIGQNAIADGEWLLTYGIDIRPQTYFDTMIAEHTLNSSGIFNLTALTEKYTQMGKYDVHVKEWVDEHPKETEEGYGAIPSELLIPYAACDVTATYRVFMRQYKLLAEAGYLNPRGEYPSLFQSSLNCQMALYEIQRNGILFDHNRYDSIASAYHIKLQDLENQMIVIAIKLGMPDFNFRSVQQVSRLMFEKLKLTPIKATAAHGNKPWDQIRDEAKLTEVAASTDKRTMDILQDQHPAIALLRDLRKIDHACKTWMPTNYDPAIHNEITKGGGLQSKVWPDGRVHASFSQLKETGRFSSRKPNMQNFPKRAEGDMARIFGKDKKPPDIRTIFVPEPGYVIMESDWKQAELFTLAGLSGDQNMLDALRTPGKDLHDLTAITAFGLKVLDEHGHEVQDQVLLDMAAEDVRKYGTCEGHDFEKYQHTLQYLDQRGLLMSRGTFKGTIRVSAKNLNFGCRLYEIMLFYWQLRRITCKRNVSDAGVVTPRVTKSKSTVLGHVDLSTVKSKKHLRAVIVGARLNLRGELKLKGAKRVEKSMLVITKCVGDLREILTYALGLVVVVTSLAKIIQHGNHLISTKVRSTRQIIVNVVSMCGVNNVLWTPAINHRYRFIT